MVVGQLVRRQLPLRLADRAHGADILFAVLDHLGHQVCVVAERAVCLRDRQQADKLAAAMILAHPGTGKAPDILKATRRAVGAGLRGGAVELLQPVVDLEDVPEDQALKRGVVRPDLALVVRDGLRERLIRQPRPHALVVEGVGHAQHVGAGVLRVIVDAALGQVAPAPGFKVDPEHGHAVTQWNPQPPKPRFPMSVGQSAGISSMNTRVPLIRVNRTPNRRA